MIISANQAQETFDNAEQIFSLEEVETAMDRIAEQINEQLAGSDPLVLTVMNGGLIPAARLITRLNFPLRQDYIHATRYRETLHGHGLTWVRKPVVPLRGRAVLIIDDILDEGYTLEALLEACWDMGPESVHTALLCEKLHERGADIEADFVALKVPDRYVFGYGMDYKGYLRNAPGIFAANE